MTHAARSACAQFDAPTATLDLELNARLDPCIVPA